MGRENAWNRGKGRTPKLSTAIADLIVSYPKIGLGNVLLMFPGEWSVPCWELYTPATTLPSNTSQKKYLAKHTGSHVVIAI